MYLNSYALSAEELQLEERFVADMEIVIGQLSENTIDDGDGGIGSNYSFDSVFARTAPNAPVSLALEGPGTLDGQIGDGAPSDDPLQSANDYALTGPLAVSVSEAGGTTISDVSTDAPSDQFVNTMLIADTDDSNLLPHLREVHPTITFGYQQILS